MSYAASFLRHLTAMASLNMPPVKVTSFGRGARDARPGNARPFCSRRRKLRILSRHELTPGAAGWTRAGRKAARRLWQTARTRDEYEAGMARLAAIEHERATGVPRQEAGT